MTEVIKNEREQVQLNPREYERTDQELEVEPEFQHLLELCIELGLNL